MWFRKFPQQLATVVLLLVLGSPLDAGPSVSQAGRTASEEAKTAWLSLIAEAQRVSLPIGFLGRITPGFITLSFADLRTFAAEYHPEDHRIVLNRTLSLNAAGRTLRPLSRLTHRELGTLYHELFHAYMDFIDFSSGGAEPLDPISQRLLAFARREQHCRYRHVLITPVLQRKGSTEERFLTDRESWEAMNETWGVFVGWAVWTRLELAQQAETGPGLGGGGAQGWLDRLHEADRTGRLVGYYEPEHPQERALTHKRYLAPIHRITASEVKVLLEAIFDEPQEIAARSASVMLQDTVRRATPLTCQE